MTKPIGPICNLDCSYCFYLEKEKLLEEQDRAPRTSWQMDDEVLETYIRQYITSQETEELSFAWQGGEPTLLGVRFFRRVIELQRKYSDGRTIHNAIQTNGTLLNEEWCEFLAREKFLAGISIDGPREFHDAYRLDKNQQPTFDAVIRGVSLLKQYGVEFNTLTVVSRTNSRAPIEIYRFLKEIGSTFLQFIPLVERRLQNEGTNSSALIQIALAPPPRERQPYSMVTEWSVLPEGYGEFLVRIFDEWVRNDVGKVFVQLFDSALGSWLGEGASLCVFAETCGRGLAMEQNGDVYSCDHYVYPEYLLGNIMASDIWDIANSHSQRQFGADKRDTLPKYCRRCEVRFACNGECPKHRFHSTPDGEWGLNYLCAAYKQFFTHIHPYMSAMVDLLRRQRSPAEIMPMLKTRENPGQTGKPGRNDDCPCGSGRKYKKCCLERK